MQRSGRHPNDLDQDPDDRDRACRQRPRPAPVRRLEWIYLFRPAPTWPLPQAVPHQKRIDSDKSRERVRRLRRTTWRELPRRLDPSQLSPAHPSRAPYRRRGVPAPPPEPGYRISSHHLALRQPFAFASNWRKGSTLKLFEACPSSGSAQSGTTPNPLPVACLCGGYPSWFSRPGLQIRW